MKKITQLSFSAFLAVFLTSGAYATPSSSSKAAAAYKDVNIVEELVVDGNTYVPADGYVDSDCSDPTEEEINLEKCVPNPAFFTESKYRILSTYIKVPHGKDLAIDVSLECGNFASITSKGMGKSIKGSAAVRVAVVVTDKDGNSVFAEPNHLPDNPGVVFCKNSLALTATLPSIFQIGEPQTIYYVEVDGSGDLDEGTYGESCDEGDTCKEVTTLGTCLFQGINGEIQVDTNCLTGQEMSMMTGNMSANAFNFFYPNVKKSGVYKIDVLAWVEKQVDSKGKTAKGEIKATIGLGSMFIETVRLREGETGKDENKTCNFVNDTDCIPLEE